MDRIELDGDWTLRHGRQRRPASGMGKPDIPPEWNPLPARVPGNVELDLVRAGLLPPDLDAGNHIYLLRPLETHQWWYTRTFDVEAETAAARYVLVLEGVDTLATLWLNDERIGSTDNMLIPHRIDVSGRLRAGRNVLTIGIDSAVLAAKDAAVDPGEWAQEGNWESLSLRKAPHGFGWDIMPRVVSAGLWRSVHLDPVRETAFREVYLATATAAPATRQAELLVNWHLTTAEWPLDGWSVRLGVYPPGAAAAVFEADVAVLCAHAEIRCKVTGIDLWWPRGYGPAALYEIRLELLDGAGKRRAAWQGRHGFRTVVLDRTDGGDPAVPMRFDFVVNGERIFVKGTNWVPLDAFHSRDAERLAETFALLVGLNCNMVRCWGGNVYESDAFFDRCDEAGVIVWQDFALGCALYPQTEAFFAQIRREADAIVPRLRNHPALALWSGNNEVDAFALNHRPRCDPNVADRISREVLPAACRRLDPWRDYLPSSPFISSRLWARGGDPALRPEDHLWGPRDDFKGRYYRASNASFASEIGYHGCPSRASLQRMILPGRLWPWQGNDEWITHAVRPLERGTIHNGRIALMAHQIGVLFGAIPSELDDFIAASQMSQAEALKFFIERFRIGKGRRSGILWWNLRDGWPEISDAVVDYYGGRKLAYETIRRVQTDVCVMLDEPLDGHCEVVAVNDTRQPAEIEVSIRDGDQELFRVRATVPANGRSSLGGVAAARVPAWYDIEWRSPSGAGQHNHYLAGPRPFALSDCRRWYGI